MPAARFDESGFFVGLDIAVDEGGDVVVVFFFKKSIIRVICGVIAEIDVVVHDSRDLVVGGVCLFQGHNFRASFRQFGFFVIRDGGAGGGAR